MGADMKLQQDPEQQPLLVAPGVPVGAAFAEPTKGRSWRGHWAQLLGNGEPTDVGACCLAWHAPPVAFGWNAQRALGKSFWKEGLKFALLTIGLFVLGKAVVCAAMMAACPPPPPPPMMGDGTMMSVNAASATGAAATTTVSAWHMPSEDVDEDDWHHEHGHGGWQGAGPHPLMVDSPEMQQCMEAVMPAAVACAVISVLGIAAVIVMAARRRTAIRERFGIDGTPAQDCCLWTWCSICALAQETRTLMHNEVHTGYWHGPHDAPAPVTV